MRRPPVFALALPFLVCCVLVQFEDAAMFAKKFGTFVESIAKTINSVFGTGGVSRDTSRRTSKSRTNTNVAKRRGTFSKPTVATPPAKGSGGTIRENPVLTTEEYRIAMEKAARETLSKIERDAQVRFGTASSANQSEALRDEWQKQLAKEAVEDMERRTRFIEEKQKNLSPVMAFLYGDITPVTSSNVELIQFDRERQMLYIQYKNGAWYVYYDVDAHEAESFFNSPSKGGWVWDNLRVRKTAWGRKKDYAFLEYNLGGYTPRYMSDDGYQKEHAAIPPSGEPPASWKVAGAGPYSDLPWYTKSPGKDADPHQLPTAKFV